MGKFMVKRKLMKKTVGCLMALTMVVTNFYVGIGFSVNRNVGIEKIALAAEKLSYTVGNSSYF